MHYSDFRGLQNSKTDERHLTNNEIILTQNNRNDMVVIQRDRFRFVSERVNNWIKYLILPESVDI